MTCLCAAVIVALAAVPLPALPVFGALRHASGRYAESLAWYLRTYDPLLLLTPVVVLAAVLGSWWARRRARATPRSANPCGHCGYDRGVMPAAAKCPECGELPPM